MAHAYGPCDEEALHDAPLLREFAALCWESRLNDENAIHRFHHLIERHKLADQILVLVNDLLISRACRSRPAGGRCHADLCAELDQEQEQG